MTTCTFDSQYLNETNDDSLFVQHNSYLEFGAKEPA